MLFQKFKKRDLIVMKNLIVKKYIMTNVRENKSS